MTIYVLAGKGGVGKTSTVINIAACAVENQIPVTICDIDPQGNAVATAHNMAGVKVSGSVKPQKGRLLIVDAPASVIAEHLIDGLRAADIALLPVAPIIDSVAGNLHVHDFLKQHGVPVRTFVTMFHPASEDDRMIRALAWKNWPDSICRTTIPFSTAIVRAQNRRESVIEYAPDSPGARAYRRLYAEITGGNHETKSL